jgi:hypothetical protein
MLILTIYAINYIINFFLSIYCVTREEKLNETGLIIISFASLFGPFTTVLVICLMICKPITNTLNKLFYKEPKENYVYGWDKNK